MLAVKLFLHVLSDVALQEYLGNCPRLPSLPMKKAYFPLSISVCMMLEKKLF